MQLTKNYWLFAGQVVTIDKKKTIRQVNMNVLVVTENMRITRLDLANAQKAFMRRFMTQCEQIKGAEINDVFIMAINHLGTMTPEEFHAGFSGDMAEEMKQSQGLN